MILRLVYIVFLAALPAQAQPLESLRANMSEVASLLSRITIDTVYVGDEPVHRPIPDSATATLVEEEAFADSTGYRIYADGADTLVAFSKGGWFALHGDAASYQFHADTVTLPRQYWNLTLEEHYHGAGENRHSDVLSLAGTLQALRKKAASPPPAENLVASWAPGDPINLGPVPIVGDFRVETRFTVTSWSSWMRVVGKSGGPSPVHWWLVELSSNGAVHFRVRIGGSVQTVSSPASLITLNNPVTVEAAYTGDSLDLTINGQTYTRAVSGERDDDPALDAWVWLQGAPDTRLLAGSIEYVQVHE